MWRYNLVCVDVQTEYKRVYIKKKKGKPLNYNSGIKTNPRKNN